jgi:hypothetical protein
MTVAQRSRNTRRRSPSDTTWPDRATAVLAVYSIRRDSLAVWMSALARRHIPCTISHGAGHSETPTTPRGHRRLCYPATTPHRSPCDEGYARRRRRRPEGLLPGPATDTGDRRPLAVSPSGGAAAPDVRTIAWACQSVKTVLRGFEMALVVHWRVGERCRSAALSTRACRDIPRAQGSPRHDLSDTCLHSGVAAGTLIGRTARAVASYWRWSP